MFFPMMYPPMMPYYPPARRPRRRARKASKPYPGQYLKKGKRCAKGYRQIKVCKKQTSCKSGGCGKKSRRMVTTQAQADRNIKRTLKLNEKYSLEEQLVYRSLSAAGKKAHRALAKSKGATYRIENMGPHNVPYNVQGAINDLLPAGVVPPQAIIVD